MIAVTGLVFGPIAGAVVGTAGSLISAAVGYWLGQWLGRERVLNWFGPRVQRLHQRLSRRGMLTMLSVRLLPWAPFIVVNAVAGVSGLRLRDFLLGTLCGMLPGIVLTVTFVDSLVESIRHPNAGAAAILLIVALFLIAAGATLQRLLWNKGRSA
jgi:uncharacterized membrane protein YdjX (TVP38/TMEM64 family)